MNKTNRRDSVPNFFVGDYDLCERLISCLQYSSFCSTDDSEPSKSVDEISTHFEKGALYKGMSGLNDETGLMNKVQFLREKFSEFDER